MKTFTLYWRGGTKETVTGNDIADAMNRAGYGGGALRALDFHASGDNNDYEWRDGEWHNISPEFLAMIAEAKASS